MNKVAFLDLRIQDLDEKNELLAAVEAVFDHGRLVLGPEVEELEKLIANYCNRKYAVCVGSGTSALFFALKSLNIGPGDEVITTALSWIATANAIALTGATPVFADVEDDLNINVNAIENLITPKTKAIMPVHFTGKVCNMEKIEKIAKKHNLKIIEDASQAFGAKSQGKISGSFGDIACFSLNPMKLFGACGEAGVILSDDESIYDRLISLRYNGTVNREMCIEPSINGRIDTLQAAILIKRLTRIPQVISTRRKNAAFYNENLPKAVKTPSEHPGDLDIYYTYTIQSDRRDELKAHLEKRGVETKIQHPYLMNDQPAYKHLKNAEQSNAANLIKKVLCIPIHEKLTQAELSYVSDCIHEFYS